MNTIKTIIQGSPLLYFGIGLVRSNIRRLRVRKDGDLVIEAFPRCANTTTVYSFMFAQKRPMKVGHHLHVPAHVKYAVKHSVPCLNIIRDPLDCVASLLLREGRSESDAIACLHRYIKFYKVVEELNSDLVVVDFRRIIQDGVGFSVEALNAKFATNFEVPEGCDLEREWVKMKERQWNDMHDAGDPNMIALPSPERVEKADGFREYMKTRCTRVLAEAGDLYTKIKVI